MRPRGEMKLLMSLGIRRRERFLTLGNVRVDNSPEWQLQSWSASMETRIAQGHPAANLVCAGRGGGFRRPTLGRRAV
jgi:hypothetical protein